MHWNMLGQIAEIGKKCLIVDVSCFVFNSGKDLLLSSSFDKVHPDE